MEDNTDPRLTEAHVRRVRSGPHSLTLVGVVHDHPASTYRVRHVVEELDPDVLGLELPPMAIPLFEQYAADERTPPAFGGEMSAAIQAATTDTVVGIDRPTGGYLLRLARELRSQNPTRTTRRRVLVNVVAAIKHAAVCRLAAGLTARTGVRLEVDFPVDHDVDDTHSPDEQARDERTQVRRSRAFMNAFRTASVTRASRFEDRIREAHMAAALRERSADGTVVAVVGIDHLEPIARRVTEPDGS